MAAGPAEAAQAEVVLRLRRLHQVEVVVAANPLESR